MSFNVLIVDDDFINRKLISTLLKKHTDIVGSMVEAENGSEALSILREDKNINMILLDIMMPILDGKEFLKIFRADEANNSIPVIVLSTDDTQRTAVFNHGADAFLLKPIKEGELLPAIKEWIT
ncbi:MAG: response regulator [Sulfurovum sp.]|nr:response regulator [Sulfurovum sp.]